MAVDNSFGRTFSMVVGFALIFMLAESTGAVSWNKLWNSSDIGSISSIAV